MSTSNLDSSLDETYRCSTSACIADQNENQLRCGECKRFVHFRCTMLPAYQIQIFINKRMKFTCCNCVNIQNDLVHLLKSQDVPFYVLSRDKVEINRLKKELKACENILTVQGNNQRELTDTINRQMKESKEIQQSIEECIKTEMKEIRKVMEERTSTKSYAAAVGAPAIEAQSKEFQNFMKVAKIEDISEERDRKSRAQNIIVHGIEENPLDSSDPNQLDKEWFSSFQKDIDVKVEAKFIGRIGNRKPLNHRPLKVVLKSEEEKRKVFTKLRRLKGKQEYKNISISEDFTNAERSVIKTWIEKAKERNEQEGYESNIIFRVRGSPKRGTMRLKKFTIDQHSHQN